MKQQNEHLTRYILRYSFAKATLTQSIQVYHALEKPRAKATHTSCTIKIYIIIKKNRIITMNELNNVHSPLKKKEIKHTLRIM